jgi:hypothetical protein
MILFIPFVVIAIVAGSMAGGLEAGGSMAWGQRIWAFAFAPGRLFFSGLDRTHIQMWRIFLFILLELVYFFVLVFLFYLIGLNDCIIGCGKKMKAFFRPKSPK